MGCHFFIVNKILKFFGTLQRYKIWARVHLNYPRIYVLPNSENLYNVHTIVTLNSRSSTILQKNKFTKVMVALRIMLHCRNYLYKYNYRWNLKSHQAIYSLCKPPTTITIKTCKLISIPLAQLLHCWQCWKWNWEAIFGSISMLNLTY